MSRETEENNNNIANNNYNHNNNIANGNYNVPIDDKPQKKITNGKIGRKVTKNHVVNEKEPNLNRGIYQDTYKPYTIFGKLYFVCFLRYNDREELSVSGTD